MAQLPAVLFSYIAMSTCIYCEQLLLQLTPDQSLAEYSAEVRGGPPLAPVKSTSCSNIEDLRGWFGERSSKSLCGEMAVVSGPLTLQSIWRLGCSDIALPSTTARIGRFVDGRQGNNSLFTFSPCLSQCVLSSSCWKFSRILNAGQWSL